MTFHNKYFTYYYGYMYVTCNNIGLPLLSNSTPSDIIFILIP